MATLFYHEVWLALVGVYATVHFLATILWPLLLKISLKQLPWFAIAAPMINELADRAPTPVSAFRPRRHTFNGSEETENRPDSPPEHRPQINTPRQWRRYFHQ